MDKKYKITEQAKEGILADIGKALKKYFTGSEMEEEVGYDAMIEIGKILTAHVQEDNYTARQISYLKYIRGMFAHHEDDIACEIYSFEQWLEGQPLPSPANVAHSWIDDNDYHWEWDGNRVYCLEAEKEMMENGEDVRQNGYLASSPDEALSILMAGGYIEPTKDFFTLPAPPKEGERRCQECGGKLNHSLKNTSDEGIGSLVDTPGYRCNDCKKWFILPAPPKDKYDSPLCDHPELQYQPKEGEQ